MIGQLAELAGYLDLDERCFSLDPIAVLDLMAERGFLALALDASFTGESLRQTTTCRRWRIATIPPAARWFTDMTITPAPASGRV
ncbi:hypothetical protein ACXIUS_24645 [Bosea thiooxidans]